MKRLCIMMLILMMFAFAGCGHMTEKNSVEPSPSASPVQTAEPSPEVSTPAPAHEEEKLTANAVYSGRADSNFIEIILNDKYVSAKLSPQLKQSFDSLDIEEEDEITIEYTFEKGLYEVYKISKN